MILTTKPYEPRHRSARVALLLVALGIATLLAGVLALRHHPTLASRAQLPAPISIISSGDFPSPAPSDSGNPGVRHRPGAIESIT
jgi:hypothetical protein